MSSQRLYYETHMHTPLCHHAVGEPEEYALEAHARGLEGIIVTCHNPMPGTFGVSTRMRRDQFDDYVALVERAKVAMSGIVDVRLGLECDYLPGTERWLDAQLSSADFHYVLGSVHPHLDEYKQAYWTDDARTFQRTYFGHLAVAAETGLFDALAHPDLIKNMTPEQWHPHEILDHIGASLDRIAAAGCALELNTSGLNKLVAEMNPGEELLYEIKARNIPMVVGADAHEPARVADRFDVALDALERVGFETVSLFLGRKRIDYPIERVRRSLTEPRRAGAVASETAKTAKT